MTNFWLNWQTSYLSAKSRTDWVTNEATPQPICVQQENKELHESDDPCATGPRLDHWWVQLRTLSHHRPLNRENGSRGHYFTIGKRSEPTPSGDTGWYRMDERTAKPAELAETRLLAGKSSTWECENTAYVVFRLRRWLKKTRIKRGSSEELDQQIILASACFTVTAYIVLSLSRRFTTGEYSWSELVSPKNVHTTYNMILVELGSVTVFLKNEQSSRLKSGCRNVSNLTDNVKRLCVGQKGLWFSFCKHVSVVVGVSYVSIQLCLHGPILPLKLRPFYLVRLPWVYAASFL